MKHFEGDFDKNCYELRVLEWFADNFVSQEDMEFYYRLGPVVVEAIDNNPNSDMIYEYIYDNVVDACVTAIENGDYNFAYDRYKSSVISLGETFAKPYLQKILLKY